jgi:hypothetical protein
VIFIFHLHILLFCFHVAQFKLQLVCDYVCTCILMSQHCSIFTAYNFFFRLWQNDANGYVLQLLSATAQKTSAFSQVHA